MSSSTKSQRSSQRKPASSDAIKADEKTVFPPSLSLVNLHFDPANPRFGDIPLVSRSETEILDEIVDRYGVDGVIGSIAVNGYLETEPLVALGTAKNARVIEGNRRLAALLILADDPRSANQGRLREVYPLQTAKPIDPVPVVLYGQKAQPKQLLPYLGVKHIIGPKVWDSYAKAAWIAKVTENPEDGITLETVQDMLGDSLGTIRRLMSGYYVVHQLVERGKFKPEDSEKKGRGSASEFPFSWVYNALDYSSVKQFLGLEGGDPKPYPLPPDREDAAVEFLSFMFGSRARKMRPRIDESRQIGSLAACLSDPEKVKRLESGARLEDIEWQFKTGEEKLTETLRLADEALGKAAGAVYDLDRGQARAVRPLAERVRDRSRDIVREIQKKVDGDEE